MDARGHIRCDLFTHTHLCQQTNGLEPCGRTYAQCGRPYARGIFPCEDPGEVVRAADEMLDLTGGGGRGKKCPDRWVQGSRQVVGRYVPGLRRAGSRPGGVPRICRLSHVPAGNLFRLPIHCRHNLCNALTCDSLRNGAPHPKRMKGKMPRPQAGVFQVLLETRCHGVCGKGSSPPLWDTLSRRWHFREKVPRGHIPSA